MVGQPVATDLVSELEPTSDSVVSRQDVVKREAMVVQLEMVMRHHWLVMLEGKLRIGQMDKVKGQLMEKELVQWMDQMMVIRTKQMLALLMAKWMVMWEEQVIGSDGI